MLVLSRKTGQSITIGGNVSIQILRVQGNQVRIGIEAPREIRVVRSELQEYSSPVINSLESSDNGSRINADLIPADSV